MIQNPGLRSARRARASLYLLVFAGLGLSGCASHQLAKPQTVSRKRQPGPYHQEIKSELANLKLAEAVAKVAVEMETPPNTDSKATPKAVATIQNPEKPAAKILVLPKKRPSRKALAPLSAGEVKVTLQKQVQQPAANAALKEATMQITDADETSEIQISKSTETPLIFDIPVTYNERVRQWIRYFQGEGRLSFRTWLERSSRFLPLIQYELTRAAMPLDLSYVAMIESGFQSHASSHAGAIGLWQFIEATGSRYGLHIDWWIDERRDFYKSTKAAVRYMSELNKQFESWWLVAASYNMGENGVRRLVSKRKTNNFWELADMGALPTETRDYVPKIIAAILISKAPALYGFRDLNFQMPLSYESIEVPGGTDLINLANYLGVSEKYLKDLNPELIKGFIPRHVRGHRIRVPKGSMMAVSQYIQQQTAAN